MWELGSNIAIGPCVLDMWSALRDIYVGAGVYNSDRSVRTGHVVSVVFSICWLWCLT